MTEKEEFEAILDVFTTDGWKLILEDISKRYDSINNIDDVSTVEELYRRKGEQESLRWFMSLKEWYQYAQELSEGRNAV